jgi:tetratricopeptide (TPR) repeat protein
MLTQFIYLSRARASAAAAAVAAVVMTGLVAEPLAATGSSGACSVEQGQSFIDDGRYRKAVAEFTCVIGAQPTGVDGYRGRIEAQLLLGLYSDALRDYTRVTAYVLPVQPGAASVILAGYATRLSADPVNVPALTGASFARWYFFQYAQATQLLNTLVSVSPDNVYGNLFRGSSRVLSGSAVHGVPDLDRAIELAPESPDVRFIVADAYTYGLPDPNRALNEATLALGGGLDTPRVHAILGSAWHALGDQALSAWHIARHIDLVTAELVAAPVLDPGVSLALPLVPGRVYEIPVPAVAGEILSIATGSHDYTDTILVLRGPDGTPVVASDDAKQYYAALGWTAPATGTYMLRATFFESVNTGVLTVARK